MSSSRVVVSVDDLAMPDVEWIQRTAAGYAHGVMPDPLPPFVVGLLFTTSSLRTRLGFGVAAVRLGGSAIDTQELRWGARMSEAESFADTLRTMSGMVDVVVARTAERLDPEVVRRSCVSAFVNAGDGDGEHPTQAVIDLCAIVAERGDVAGQRIGICGDLTSRCAHSLVRLLDRHLPGELALFAPPGRDDLGVGVGPELASRISWRKPGELDDLDVLYLTGLPEGRGDDRIGPDVRQEYALTRVGLDRMSADAVVISPMPVIDEISADARMDPRVRVFAQSDRGVFVRTALLARLLMGDGFTSALGVGE
ncbi:MAG: aspartate carbamoyltransferase catalytic subunit [Frankiaceae bacterium]|jgi:aspartate carbamoyltransferase catalytic subunit|nr:aspartate carbamoyltransferase catalytic subunit [Frankiaceae bacterium]